MIDVETRQGGQEGPRCRPAKMFLVDTEAGRIIDDSEVKAEVAAANPWAEWLKDNLIDLKDLPRARARVHTAASVNIRQRTFGYTTEELKILLGPMARTGGRGRSAPWVRTPGGRALKRPRLLFDTSCSPSRRSPTRRSTPSAEELVTSLTCAIGPNGNLLDTKQVRQPQVSLPFPVINNDQLAKIANIEKRRRGPRRHEGARPLPSDGGEHALRARLTEICEQVSGAINRGVQYVVLSDRDSNAQWGADSRPCCWSARAPPPAAQRQPHQDRAGGSRRGDVRENPPRRRPDRLRRLRGEPVPGDGIRRTAHQFRRRHRGHPAGRRLQPDQGPRQGRPEDHVQDGHLDGRVLHRRADLRSAWLGQDLGTSTSPARIPSSAASAST